MLRTELEGGLNVHDQFAGHSADSAIAWLGQRDMDAEETVLVQTQRNNKATIYCGSNDPVLSSKGGEPSQRNQETSKQ